MTQPIHPMLGRVASKIMEARDGKPCKVKDWYCEEQENPHVAKALRQARAAVRALMEPDGGMKRAGADELFGSVEEDWTVDARRVFRAMLRPLVGGEGE